MAEVYLAHDEVLDRDVALKVLMEKYAKGRGVRRTFPARG
jgi:serine/threonine protein kinase